MNENIMNCYEHTMIVKQDYPQKQIPTLIKKYEEIINKNSGKIIKIEEWGLLNFSKKLEKNKKGYYIHLKIEGNGITIQELEKNEKIDNKLLRLLTVKVKKFDLDTKYFEDKEKNKKLI